MRFWCPPLWTRLGWRDRPVAGRYAMWVCIICRFEVFLDDTITPLACGKCICCKCYKREVGDMHPMPNTLRMSVRAVLAGIEG